MQGRELGRSGLKISVLGLGTMSWGEQNTEAEAHAQMDAALDAGIDPVHGALSFVRGRTFVATTLIGATSVQQLQHNIASLEVNLSREVLDGIQSIYHRYGTTAP